MVKISQKTIMIFAVVLTALFSVSWPVSAFEDAAGEQEKVTVHFFEDKWCSVCQETKTFIESLKQDYPDLE